jgi:alpha-tubulin suppressor-like RCC1 family protein
MTTLIYPANKTGCTNVLLVDRAVRDAQIFIDSVNASTFPILYSSASSKTELLGVLQSNFTTLDRIGLAFHGSGSGVSVQFLDNAPFFISPVEASPYSENVEFILSVIRQFQVKNIDYLACNTLQYPSWVDYYALLTRETGVIVGASNDQTGNIQYGGDWIMESTSQDIELIYFTESIEYYTYLLLTVADGNTIIIQDGIIYGCGDNSVGQLGTGVVGSSTLTPMVNTTGLTPKYISTTYNRAIVLMTTGEIYGCGSNDYGQLGTAVAGDKTTLTQMVNSTGLTPKYIECGDFHTIVLMTTGEIYGCGLNNFGQLGTTDTPTTTLVQMVNNTGLTPTYIACGARHTIVLMTTGEIYGCGDNGSGQIGTGGGNTLTLIDNITGLTPTYIACGERHTIVLMTTGEIYGCGDNFYGQLGTGGGSTLTLLNNSTGLTPQNIKCGERYTIVLMETGEIYGCGNNLGGQLGTSNYDPTSTLTQMVNTTGKIPKYIACQYIHTVVLMTDGTVYGCGLNNVGQLGVEDTIGTYDGIPTLIQLTNGTRGSYLMNNIDSHILPPLPPVACFKTDAKILTNKGYVPVQDLKKGDLVQTYLNGYQPIEMMGYNTINHHCLPDRNDKQLYVCSPAQYPEVFEDLVLTGAHSILVDNFVDETQRKETEKVLSLICVTDRKYRLPACVDRRTTVYDKQGTYTIYHLALAHENYYMNYGIYANGLLVETCSRRYLKELSGMTLIE